jgi:hypothetical protein
MKKRAAKSHKKNVTTSILRGLGKGPKPPASDEPDDALDYRSDGTEMARGSVTPSFIRLHPDTARDLATLVAGSLQFHPQTVSDLAKAVALQLQFDPETIEKLGASIYGHLEENMAGLVELNMKQADGNVACSECADGDERFVHPSGDMSTESVRVFMGWTDRATLYSRKKLGGMPPPLSAQPPLLYDPHVIALLKYRGIVFPKARYDRATHRALLPKVEAERAKRKRAFHEKQSAMMARENRRRAAERARKADRTPPPASRARASKSTVRRETTKQKR